MTSDSIRTKIYKIATVWEYQLKRYRENGLVQFAKLMIEFLYIRIHKKIVGFVLGKSPPLIQIYIQNMKNLFPDRYTDADPRKVLWVDPSEIEYIVDVEGTSFYTERMGRVTGGDWDLSKKRFENKEPYKSLYAHFVKGVDWEDTMLYKNLAQADNPRLASTSEELDQRFQKIDKIYHNIRSSGYMTQEELIDCENKETVLLSNDAVPPNLNEIGVNIGRNGQILWSHRGMHRLAIAKILSLNEVPVQVLNRHQEWQNLREELRKNPSIGELNAEKQQYLEHIDMQDIVFEEDDKGNNLLSKLYFRILNRLSILAKWGSLDD